MRQFATQKGSSMFRFRYTKKDLKLLQPDPSELQASYYDFQGKKSKKAQVGEKEHFLSMLPNIFTPKICF